MLARVGFAIWTIVLTGCAAAPVSKNTVPAPVTGQMLLEAAAGGQADKVNRVLAQQPGLVDARDERYLTPLHLAAQPGIDNSVRPLANYSDVVSALIEHGADVNAVGKQQATPLYLACSYAKVPETITYNGRPYNERLNAIQLETVRKLLDAGAKIDEPIEFGITPLHAAIAHEHPKLALYLLQRGASFRLKNERGTNACKLAGNYSLDEVVEYCRKNR